MISQRYWLRCGNRNRGDANVNRGRNLTQFSTTTRIKRYRCAKFAWEVRVSAKLGATGVCPLRHKSAAKECRQTGFTNLRTSTMTLAYVLSRESLCSSDVMRPSNSAQAWTRACALKRPSEAAGRLMRLPDAVATS